MDSSKNARIEELGLGGWPALQTLVYDGWLLRFADGYSRRSNSVSALYHSSLPFEEKVAACESAYSSRGLPTTFKVLDWGEGPSLDPLLATKGYAREAETRVMSLDLSSASARSPAGAELADSFRSEWIDGWCGCSQVQPSRGVIGAILGNVICPVAVASVAEKSEIIACGYGAVDRGWVGLFDIVVREDRRGRGLGEAIVQAILGRARAMGAAAAYLQVVSGNAPAERLYEKLGFVEAYRYWYRKRV